MSVSTATSSATFDALFTGRRPYDAAAMAARCGDDVVRLRPSWPAVIAATRFARNARWLFGNRVATLECVEPQRKRWLTQRGADDPVQVHFDLAHWASAYARCAGGTREIDVFAGDGSVIAAVRLDDVDASLDELLWLLVDDDQRPLAAAPRNNVIHHCAFNRAGSLAPGALHHAVLAASDAMLPLRLMVQNPGGRVAWSPQHPVVREAGRTIELRSALGSVTLGDRFTGDWNVRLAGYDRGDPRIEAYGTDDAAMLTIALNGATALQRIAWRGICATLPEN